MKRIKYPDTTNTDPEYWEKVLESHGLGVRQLGLQDSELNQTEDEDDNDSDEV